MFEFLVLCILSAKYVFCANILYVSTVNSQSHQIWNRVLALGLTEKGHNVTFMNIEKDEEQFANWTHIYVEGPYKVLQSKFNLSDLIGSKGIQTVVWTVDIGIAVCEESLHSQGLQQLLNYPRNFKFDLIIFDIIWGCCFCPLIHRFNYPPAIATTPWPVPSFLTHPFGTPLQSSHIPWYDLPYGEDMTLRERFWNHIFTYSEIALKSRITTKLQEKLVKTFGDDIPPLKKLERHISLLFSNHDVLLNYPQALTPNVIPVGGLHIASTKKLPKVRQAYVIL